MTTEKMIKDCPFCGSSARHDDEFRTVGDGESTLVRFVWCTNTSCGAEITNEHVEDELEAWNTRPAPSIVGDTETVAKAIYEQECADDPHPEACPRWEDFPDHHAPYLREARAAMEASGLGERVSRAYSERAAAAVAMARFALMSGYNAGVGKDNNEDWDDEWRVVLYVDTPAGQVSWHISPEDQHFLDGLPNYEGDWDGTFLSRDGSFLKWDQDKTDA